MATRPRATALPLEAFELGRTDTLTLAVHLTECPHLVGKDWHPATQAEIDELRLCKWSQDQLNGHGRSHPATLEDAMREQGTPAGVVPLIKEHLRFVTYDEIWLPYSRSYVALGLEGRAIASFGKSYVWVGGRRIDLPGYVAASRSGHRSQPTHGEVCPGCYQERALNGACPNDCD
jgi:hypothetical protein